MGKKNCKVGKTRQTCPFAPVTLAMLWAIYYDIVLAWG